MSRKTALLCGGLVGMLLLAPAFVQAQTVYAVGFFQTSDPSIGTVVDLNNFKPWMERIAAQSGLPLNYQAYSGDDFNVAKARQVLTALQVNENDVIYFYYSGHGANPPGKKWPVMDFARPDSSDDVSLDEVVEKLQPKNPRLLVVLADCCNSFPNQGDPLIVKEVFKDTVADAFRSLFVNFQGTVIATGASPGQYSLGGEKTGGVFTNAYMASMNSLAAINPALTWNEVLALTRKTVGEDANPQYSQTPQYVVAAGVVAQQTAQQLNLDAQANQVGNGLLGPTNASGACGPVGIFPLMLTLTGIFWMGRRYRR